MLPYKLMVIDDDLKNRRKIYKSTFSPQYFKLIFVDSPSHLKTIVNETPVDGYVIDALLDTGVWSEIGNAAKLCSEILCSPPRPAPIFLVSGQWGSTSSMDVLNTLSRKHNPAFDVLRYLAWTEFEAAIVGNKEASVGLQNAGSADNARLVALRNKILDDLSVWHERSTFRPAPNSSIRMLLLADLQYGDLHTSESAVFDEHWLVKALNRDKLIPDLLVFAGDIGCTGAPSDYQLAKTKLENNLIKFMWNEEIDSLRERLIIVPGNHDVNLRIAACDRNDWDRDGKTWKPNGVPSATNKPIDASTPISYNDYALEPFRQFARELTGSRLWDSPRIRCRVDRRFELCGIRFYLFNSIANVTVETPKKADFSNSALERINNELRKEDMPENLFSIAVSHHGIQFGGEPREQMENWGAVGQQFFNEHHIKLWMFGHYHKFDTQEVKLEEGKKLGLIQSPTLKIRPGETARGFSLIELERIDNQVVAVKVYPYTLGDKGVNEKKKPNAITVWSKP
jgi:hypothetical protein